jgi:hypothetical protein
MELAVYLQRLADGGNYLAFFDQPYVKGHRQA